MKTSAFLAAAFCLMLAGFSWAGRDLIPSESPGTPSPPSAKTFDQIGAKVGEQLGDLPLVDLDGQPIHLEKSWQHNLTLFVTSSYTCPKSRANFPNTQALAAKYKEKVNVVIVYVIEAHPKGDISPYKDVEDVTPQNIADGILERQPATIRQRLKLANQFKDLFHVGLEIDVDPMDNLNWRQLGGGPNMGILVNSDGIVIAREGWFNSTKMDAVIKAALQDQHDLLDAEKAEDAKFNAMGLDWRDAIAPFATGEMVAARALLDAHPELVNAVIPYQARGAEGGRTLLHYAIEHKHEEIAEMLLKAGAKINAQSVYVPTPLHEAAAKGDLKMVQFLLAHGADLNVRIAGCDVTPLDEAVINNHRDIADALIQAATHQNVILHRDIFVEAGLGNVQAITTALKDDATWALRADGRNRTAICYAAANGELAAIKILLDGGAKAGTAADSRFSDPASFAVERQHADALDLLLTSSGEKGHDGLATATWNKDPASIKVLLKHHADVNRTDQRGMKALHIAAYIGAADIAELLIAAGANINATEVAFDVPCGPPGGIPATLRTPLQEAALGKAPGMIRVLLAHHADVSLKDQSGETALDMANASDAPPAIKQEMIDLLTGRISATTQPATQP